MANKLSCKPLSPVQALACPELIKTALTLPAWSDNLSKQRSMHFALTNDCVNVAEHIALVGARINARSNFPEDFKPAQTPEARNPLGAVIPPPEITDQVGDSLNLVKTIP